MVAFVTFLRALATCLITNSHYTGVYPTDLIANGGLLGNIIFFAISGFCLCNIKNNFTRWYAKRATRVYIPVILLTLIYLVLGVANISSSHNIVWWFIYPTNYHFVASIIILYIPFYIIMKFDKLKNNLVYVMSGLFLVILILYFFAFDKSYYHIDVVSEPFVRLLYLESMLLGSYFKLNLDKFRAKDYKIPAIMLILFFVLYFASKLFFSKYSQYSNLQIINQVIIFALLFWIFRFFSSIDLSLQRMPGWLMKVISFLADITLEIYLVQNVILDKLKYVAQFPFNWFILTFTIIVSAYLLHIATKPIIKYINKLLEN